MKKLLTSIPAMPVAMRRSRSFKALRLWVGLALAFGGAGQARAILFPIVNYTFPGGPPSSLTPTTVDAHVTATNVNFTGSTASQGNGGGGLQVNVGPTATTESLAITGNSYFQFSLTPFAGYEMDLLNLTFDALYSGSPSGGGYGFAVRSSVDGFASNLGAAEIPSTSYTGPFAVDLSGAAFQNITTQTTFRIYAYDPLPSTASDFFRNVQVNGTVPETPAVPEPTTCLFAAGIALAIGGGRRRLQSSGGQ